VLVLTQSKSHCLQKHLRDGWSIFNPELGEYITPVPPQMRADGEWYSGTANAIYQNLYMLERSEADWILILSGDHIYRMDYAAVIKSHIERQAGVTIACLEVGLIVAGGTIIAGGGVNHSILFSGVQVQDDAIVEDAILLNDVIIGEGTQVKHCIIDKDVVVPAGETIGVDRVQDRQRFQISDDGVVVIPKRYCFPGQ